MALSALDQPLPPTGANPERALTLFPKIGKLSDALESLRYCFPELSETNACVRVVGTVKLDGMHADIVITPEGTIRYQSRNQDDLVAKGADIAGFAQRMRKIEPAILALKDAYIARHKKCYAKDGCSPSIDATAPILLAGEWIGKGTIRNNMAVTKLELAFVMYDLMINNEWVDFSLFDGIEDASARLYNIHRSGLFKSQVDLGDIDGSLARLQMLADEVVARCPFAKLNGQEGPGEGIVFKFSDEEKGVMPTNSRQWFKVKKKERPTPKGKERMDLLQEAFQSMDLKTRDKAYASYAKIVVTNKRRDQALEYVQETGTANAGEAREKFSAWIVEDCLTEERAEVESRKMERIAVQRAVVQRANMLFDQGTGKGNFGREITTKGRTQ